MLDFKTEIAALNQGYKIVGAIDEAGRGPLAGPVVAACVVFNRDFSIPAQIQARIRDSKKLSAKARTEIFEFIASGYLEVGVGFCDNDTIDRINILQSTFLAMKKAISVLKNKPEFILLDGNLCIPNISIGQKAIIKGDENILSIAAASIVAKVSRDNYMIEQHNRYPQYGFDKHKGYGTKEHIQAIKKNGLTPIHRKSFSPIKELLQSKFSC